MNQKTFTLVGLLATLATAATLLHAATPKDQGEGKFHLVYLVSAMDLKPGSKAFVDPVFFTDGKHIKSFFDYCRNHRKQEAAENWTDLKPRQIGDDTKTINNYCDNKSTILKGDGFTSFNNNGQSVRLGDIEFLPAPQEPSHVGGRYNYFTQFPAPGIASVMNITGGALPIELQGRTEDEPQHFFLMSTNGALLRRIIPVFQTNPSEARRLIGHAQKIADAAKGKMRSSWTAYNSGRPIRKFEERSSASGTEYSRPVITSFLFADFDGDGLTDVLARAIAKATIISPHDKRQHISYWVGNSIVFSKDGHSYTAFIQQGGNFHMQQQIGYAVGSPFVLVRIGECSYVLGVGPEPRHDFALWNPLKNISSCPGTEIPRIRSYSQPDRF